MTDPIDRNLASRAHIMDGYLRVGQEPERFINLVSSAADEDEALALVRAAWGLDAMQSRSVLDLQVRRLTRANIAAIAAEHAEVMDLLNWEVRPR